MNEEINSNLVQKLLHHVHIQIPFMTDLTWVISKRGNKSLEECGKFREVSFNYLWRITCQQKIEISMEFYFFCLLVSLRHSQLLGFINSRYVIWRLGLLPDVVESKIRFLYVFNILLGLQFQECVAQYFWFTTCFC